MLAAGTSKGVFLIEDGAPKQVLDSRGVRDVVVIDDRVWAGTGSGAFVSDDEGASWQDAGLSDFEVWQVRAGGEGVLYAATQPAGLFRSTDGGASWDANDSLLACPGADDWCVPVKPRLPGRARALVIDPVNPKRLWVGVEVGGIAVSTDGGDTWSMTLPGENPDLHMMFAHPENADVLYASTGYGRLDGVAEMVEGNAGVFRSEDGGKTWDYAWRGITPRYSRPMCIDHRAPFALTVASAPTAFSSYRDDDGAQAMLFRTEDGGRSWRPLCDAAHSPSAANIHGLNVDPDVVGGVVIGTDTGEVWRVSNEAEWTLVADGLPAVFSMAAA